MENLMNLKFTKKTMDTSMAEEYVKKINESTEWPENGQYHIVTNQNDITKYKTSDDVSDFIMKYELRAPNPEKSGYDLAKKIEENVEMFVQLEYLARKTDPRDVKEGHLKLMSQLSICAFKVLKISSNSLLYFNNTTPLYNLASIVIGPDGSPHSNVCPTFLLVGDINMRPLCKFFVDLCADVGFNTSIIYANPDDVEKLKLNNTLTFWEDSDNNMGCTGVIAERSDIDSAIDVFIDSSVTAPWRLKQIYVQESVFEDFKDALSAKACATLPSSGSSGLVVGNKTFMIECLTKEQGGVPIHAYRTTKELLSLIKTPYLSVWAAESALSHEISLRTASSTVWVNDYGSFEGPPRTALSVYDLVSQGVPVSNKIMETLESWSKLNRCRRLEIITAALLKATPEYRTVLLWFSMPERLDDLFKDNNNIVEITDNTVCIGIRKSGTVSVIRKSCNSLEFAIKTLVIGYAVVLETLMCEKENAFVDELKNNGVPIDIIQIIPNITCPSLHFMAPQQFLLDKLKVIRSNYGTIFAN